MQSNWYEEFFHGLALDLWRKAVTEEQTEAEADFIAGILDLPNGARILDVPCGNGRHSIELEARNSHDRS
jgi:cyclopropane fatty-acyl-phospholipid synthase-like methyltransferase